MPTAVEIAERARWLASLDPADRSELCEITLSAVEAIFDAWRQSATAYDAAVA
jgi:hypothetical protein